MGILPGVVWSRPVTRGYSPFFSHRRSNNHPQLPDPPSSTSPTTHAAAQAVTRCLAVCLTTSPPQSHRSWAGAVAKWRCRLEYEKCASGVRLVVSMYALEYARAPATFFLPLVSDNMSHSPSAFNRVPGLDPQRQPLCLNLVPSTSALVAYATYQTSTPTKFIKHSPSKNLSSTAPCPTSTNKAISDMSPGSGISLT